MGGSAMKLLSARKVLGVVIGCWTMVGGESSIAGQPTPDLEPEQGIFSVGDYPYHAAVADVLLASDKYRKCQVVFMPSFRVESAVYFVRDEVKLQPGKINIVVVEMKQPLWTDMMTLLKSE